MLGALRGGPWGVVRECCATIRRPCHRTHKTVWWLICTWAGIKKLWVTNNNSSEPLSVPVSARHPYSVGLRAAAPAARRIWRAGTRDIEIGGGMRDGVANGDCVLRTSAAESRLTEQESSTEFVMNAEPVSKTGREILQFVEKTKTSCWTF